MSECDCPLNGESYEGAMPDPCNDENEDGHLCSKPEGHDGPHAACSVAQHPASVWSDDDDEPELVTDGGEPEEDVDVWEDGILIADGGSEYGPCPGCGDVEPSYEVPGEPPFCPECGVELPPSDVVTDGGVVQVPDSVSRDEFVPAGELAEWDGPHAEFDKYGEPTGAYYVACPGCGREVLVDERSDLDHDAGCEVFADE